MKSAHLQVTLLDRLCLVHLDEPTREEILDRVQALLAARPAVQGVVAVWRGPGHDEWLYSPLDLVRRDSLSPRASRAMQCQQH